MTPEVEIKRKKILAAMSGALQPVSTTSVDPNMSTTVNAHPPQPAPANISTLPPDAGLKLPEPASGPVRVGYSTAGMTGLEKVMERRKALENSDPEQSIKERPDFIEQLPPRMKGVNAHSRLRDFGEAALAGLAMADPDNPNQILGSAIGGGVTGAVNPRGGAQLVRRFEKGVADNDIARGLKLEEEKAQLGGIEALRRQRELEPQIQAAKVQNDIDIENAKLEIERQKAAGLITKQQADDAYRELTRKETERHNRESERIQELGVGQRGQETPANLGERQRKAQAAQTELDQLTADEATAGEQKNAAYEALKQFRANHPTMTSDDAAVASQMEQEAQRLNTLYQGYATKKSEAKRRVDENSGPTTTTGASTYSGRTMSSANLEKYAKDKGLSVEEARKQVKAQGVRVQ